MQIRESKNMTKQHEITQSDQTDIKELNENIQMKILS